MRATGYARVSTFGQSQDGVSLEMQQNRIAAWCKGNGHELETVFVEARGGGRADNRPELQKAMNLVCKRRGILVVYSLSRFSRSVRDTLELTEQLDRANAHLASLSESLDTSSAVGRMIFKLLSTLAEFERDVNSERTRNALGHMRRTNRRISAKIPFGYTLADDKATLLPDTNEQAAIARILDRRAAGMTLAAIAASMESECVKTREGGRWYPATVAAILNRQHKLVT
jgi:DNA invertase Pin-like site-specific DNA recombinase